MATHTPPSSSSSQNTPTHSPTPLFRPRSPRFPQAHAKAASFLTKVHKITQKGPRTLIGTVVDTSYHLTQGYVLATTNLGVIRVYSVPYGQVVPQMAIFVRQAGPHATNKSYVFDGFAPALSTLGPTSGQVMYTTLLPLGGSSSQVLVETTLPGGFPSLAGLTGGLGYYWHFYFYLPALPSTRATLFQMSAVGGTNMPTCELLPSGILQVRSAEDNQVLATSAPVAPHAKHWVVIQPNTGNVNAIMVDGVVSVGGSTTFTFAGHGTTYTTSFLTNLDGTQPVPLGTWMSKIGYGVSYSGGSVIPLSLGGNGMYPTSDSQIPNLNLSSSQATYNRYVCTDTPGSATLANSGASPAAGSSLTVATAYTSVLATGPY